MPLGLRPDWVVAWKRIEEIYAAVQRYINADIGIPREWMEEIVLQVELLDQVRENKKI